MATVILVRHGRTTANTTGVLARRAPGVRLDAVGRQQAGRTGRVESVTMTGPTPRYRRDVPAPSQQPDQDQDRGRYSQGVVRAWRPTCPACGKPIDVDGYVSAPLDAA